MKEEVISVIIDDEFEIFENYLDHPEVDWTVDKNEIYHTCIIYGRDKYIEAMLEKKVLQKYAFPTETAIVSLAADDMKTFMDILDTVKELDANMLFKIACKRGILEAVKKLVEGNFIDPSLEYNAGYRYAALGGSKEICDYLYTDNRVKSTEDMELPSIVKIKTVAPETENVAQ